jgi:hypothetical protein
MEFEWDPRKDAANQRKHAVGFREATTVFGDPLATTFPDSEHSMSEQRFLTVGIRQRSAAGRGSLRTPGVDPDHQCQAGNSAREKLL